MSNDVESLVCLMRTKDFNEVQVTAMLIAIIKFAKYYGSGQNQDSVELMYNQIESGKLKPAHL